ncbi:MAG TPA: glycosyltransferase family 39 protein, partial [Candidatus Cybelea sp.]|nr:glycosyltransferase family 39 protein [Candidatus Cybelea sp.]
AAIARNFARLRYNILFPQTMYNGPPPNYVELELQIVPFLAATLYKVFGIHAIFGRLIAVAFSLATVATVAFFGRWLFHSRIAGLTAAYFYAVFPGSVYYGRTFMPDAAMAFFLTAALFAAAHYFVEDERLTAKSTVWVTALLSLAYLAKPVAVLALVPLIAMGVDRARSGIRLQPLSATVALIVPLLVLAIYDRAVDSHAQWHWASGITRLHVLPSLHDALTSAGALATKLAEFHIMLGVLRDRLLGSIAFALAVAGVAVLPWSAPRSRSLLWAWLAGALLYVFVVVTVERVDYYMLPLLPLSALLIAGLAARFARMVRSAELAAAARYALLAILPLVALAALVYSRSPVAEYYAYNKAAYRNAVALDRSLPPDALLVIGHYGPDVQYYIDRFGWEEDPLLWTPFDEQSAIAKGSRYFVAIEANRLYRNIELCAWLQRFPLIAAPGSWPVYVTDPAKADPNADRFWRAFRAAERAGRGRAFLDARGVCITRSSP